MTGPCAPGQRRAFTLVELLVVIAIISLLVSILVPSLDRAKDLTRLVVCQTNLAVNGKGLHMYAQDWDDRWPIRRLSSTKEGYRPEYTDTPFGTCYVKSGPDWITVGRAHGCGGYIENVSSLWCPALQYYKQPDNLNALDPGLEAAGGYHWNMRGKWYQQKDPSDRQWDYAYRTLGAIPEDLAFGIDLAILPWTFSHLRAEGGATFNVLHVDGSVSPLDTYDWFLDYAWGGSQPRGHDQVRLLVGQARPQQRLGRPLGHAQRRRVPRAVTSTRMTPPVGRFRSLGDSDG